MRSARRKGEVNGASLWIEAPRDSDRLQERRFSAAIFANDDRHIRIKRKPIEVTHGWEIERIGVVTRNRFPFQRNLPQVWFRTHRVGSASTSCLLFYQPKSTIASCKNSCKFLCRRASLLLQFNIQ